MAARYIQRCLGLVSQYFTQRKPSIMASIEANGGLKRSLETEEPEDVQKKLKTEENNETVEQASATDQSTGTTRIKHKKFALLLSYSGKGYYGMQRNVGFKTIEEDLLVALKTAGLLSEEGFTRPQAVQFQRAARTDKGVSAKRQIVNLKLPLVDGIVNSINDNLPLQIRVHGCLQVTKKFNSKSQCDARTYSYTLPTFAFAPIDTLTQESFRITPEILTEVNNLLSKFVGTHNYYNFTAKRKPLDPSTQRYIMSMSCSQPFERDGLEFAVISVKGQSFMLHQIRKMVGVTIAIARGLASLDVIDRAWGNERIDIPIAPSLGLVLEEVHYAKYNKRYGSDGIHEPFNWDSAEPLVESFWEKYIMAEIVSTERDEKSMLKWLETLPFHSYDVREDGDQTKNYTPIGRAFNTLEELGMGEPEVPSDSDEEKQSQEARQ